MYIAGRKAKSIPRLAGGQPRSISDGLFPPLGDLASPGRAYLNRLNQAVHSRRVERDYSFQVGGNVERKGREGKVSVCAKVMVCCRVTTSAWVLPGYEVAS